MRYTIQVLKFNFNNCKNFLIIDGCVTEDFTLLLKNLTRQDAGNFRCQLVNFPQQLDFHLDVLGLF